LGCGDWALIALQTPILYHNVPKVVSVNKNIQHDVFGKEKRIDEDIFGTG
jgi:hypothetical protein